MQQPGYQLDRLEETAIQSKDISQLSTCSRLIFEEKDPL